MTPPPNSDPSSPDAPGWLQRNAAVVAVAAVAASVIAVVLGVMLILGVSPDSAGGDDVGAPDASGSEEPTEALIAVKIDNAPQARPQVGLNLARYLIEVPVEGGLTRYLALFPPSDSLVGPVRSARPVDVDLVPAFSGVLVSTGGRPFVLGPLEANGITLVGTDPEDNPFQILERPAPHNVFVSLVEVPDPEARPSAFPVGEFGGGDPLDGEILIDVPPGVTWSYDGNVYTRFEDGEESRTFPDWDADTEPITADAVVVMSVNSRSAGYQDTAGADVPTFDVIGSGAVEVHVGGEVVAGTWQRASLVDTYHLRRDTGDPIVLPSGRVFIHLVPAG